MCWGDNRSGELGDGTKVQRLTPVPVSGLSGGVIVGGNWASHTCAIVPEGKLECWGANGAGQVGDGTTVDRLAPVTALGLAGTVESVALGSGFTCALTPGGRMQCWGSNLFGALGTGSSTSDVLEPETVVGLSQGVDAISAALFTACALRSGQALCWGWNGDNQVGNDTCELSCSRPVPVQGLPGPVQAISIGGFHTCALLGGGAAECWGSADLVGTGKKKGISEPVTVRGLGGGVREVSAGALHTCALLEDGTVKCWGDNSRGELGDGTKVDRLTPVQVRGLSGVQQIVSGGDHTCALLVGAEIRCWGSNRFGQLGNGKHTWDLDIYVKAHGTVTAPGYRCRSTECFTEYAPGTKLVLKAHPARGWRLAGWSGRCHGRKARCSFSLTKDATVKALFKRR